MTLIFFLNEIISTKCVVKLHFTDRTVSLVQTTSDKNGLYVTLMSLMFLLYRVTTSGKEAGFVRFCTNQLHTDRSSGSLSLFLLS